MFQADSNWMDGTVGVTQCPISPGQSYTYNFTVPNQHGTYWWHSHQKGQYTDGILGPLIIHDPNERNNTQYDEDLIVMLSGTAILPALVNNSLLSPIFNLFAACNFLDWYHEISPVSMANYLTAGNTEGMEPVPESGLINGINVFDCSGSTNSSAACEGGARASFNFTPGKRYRIRLINTG